MHFWNIFIRRQKRKGMAVPGETRAVQPWFSQVIA